MRCATSQAARGVRSHDAGLGDVSGDGFSPILSLSNATPPDLRQGTTPFARNPQSCNDLHYQRGIGGRGFESRRRDRDMQRLAAPSRAPFVVLDTAVVRFLRNSAGSPEQHLPASERGAYVPKPARISPSPDDDPTPPVSNAVGQEEIVGWAGPFIGTSLPTRPRTAPPPKPSAQPRHKTSPPWKTGSATAGASSRTASGSR